MKSKHLIKLIAVIFTTLYLLGCKPSAPTTFRVQLLFQNQPIDCQSKITLKNGQWQLSQLQFYLADFQLDGKTLLLQQNANTPWQQPRLALLGSDCHHSGQWQLHFAEAVPPGELSFYLGVPAELNHQNPLTAVTPLNQADMFWNWQGGHKFFRLELQGTAQSWALHLGSTGCKSASVLRPPAQPCEQPNLAKVRLPYQGEANLTLDLAPLLADFSPSAAQSCMSDPLKHSCQLLLPRLLQKQQALWQFIR